MKKLRNSIVAGLMLPALLSYSQNEIEALRYSQNFPAGTARYTSMGGAFGALGGDISTLTQNPAGIAIYRKSEITLTPSVFSSNSKSSHYGTTAYGSKTNFNFANIGIVATFDSGGNNGWVSSSIAFGHNRLNNFNSRFTIEGLNNNSSLLDMYRNQVEQNNFSPFGSELAWNAYLVDIDTVSGNLFTQNPNYKELQRKTINRSGTLGETFFTFGGNYENKLYLGGTIGFTRARFSETSTYTEVMNAKDTSLILENFSITENLSTSGSGINFKLGMIYRINDFVRLGGAIHSPTYYDFSDKWDAALDVNFKDSVTSYSSPAGINDYSLYTPFKAIGSMAFIFGKSGLLSLDYEFLDYSLARLSGSGANNYSYSAENSNISNNYKSAGNIKIGTEWKLNPFSIRAGYTNYGNPFVDGVGNKARYSSYTAGFGIRDEGYFIDFAYIITQGSENYYLYDPALVQPTGFELVNQSFLLTLGVRF